MGLSFSVTRKHPVGQVKMKDKHNDGARIHVYWTLDRPDLPEKMSVYELIKKLKKIVRK